MNETYRIIGTAKNKIIKNEQCVELNKLTNGKEQSYPKCKLIIRQDDIAVKLKDGETYDIAFMEDISILNISIARNPIMIHHNYNQVYPYPNQLKLSIELIPSNCHYDNVRTSVTDKQWDSIRFPVYKSTGNKCDICGYYGRLECHEVWSYNDYHNIQYLERMQPLCNLCHSAKHPGMSHIRGIKDEVINHTKKINGFTDEQYNEYNSAMWQEFLMRSKKKPTYDLDISKIKDYGVELDSYYTNASIRKIRIDKAKQLRRPLTKTA